MARVQYDTCETNEQTASGSLEETVRIAALAKEFEEKAKAARERAEYITDLAKRATSEADSINELALDILNTAKSVAGMALRICNYSTLEEAYEHYPSLHTILDLENFKSIINSQARNSNDIASAFQRRKSTPEKMPTSPIKSSPRRLSASAPCSPRANYETSPLSPKFDECFPEHLGNASSGSLVFTFDSSNASLPPLTEDAYCQHTPEKTAGTWADKKDIRKMQLKLLKAELSDSDRDETQDRYPRSSLLEDSSSMYSSDGHDAEVVNSVNVF